MVIASLAVVCVLLGSGWAAIEEDLVKNLPGLSTQPKFKHYSGYLNATGTRKLHYWFVESQSDPSKDPVVLWLNGGPGCSSLDGLLTEHGPFLAIKNGLKVNPYSWNTVANVLYLESPAGVGFSYADDKNYTTGDDQVALDNHQALKYFMSHYPEFSHQDFFITGESYGGIYVPTLSARVVDDPSFNFKGFAVGNGYSSADYNSNSLIFFLYYHGLMGTKTWSKIGGECCKGNLTRDCNIMKEASKSESCANAVNEGRQGLDDINIYNLYGECYQGPDVANDTHIKVAPLDARPLHMLDAMDRSQNDLMKLDYLKKKKVPTATLR